MAVVTVQPNDTLYGIAQRLGINWTDLWNANKDLVPDYRKMRVGTQLRVPGTETPTPTIPDAAPSLEKAPLNFSDVVKWENFFPSQQAQTFAESQINPEYARQNESQVGTFDTAAALANAFRSGFVQKNKQDLQDQIERQRKTSVADWIDKQKTIFNDLYNKEMVKFNQNPNQYNPNYQDLAKQYMTPAA